MNTVNASIYIYIGYVDNIMIDLQQLYVLSTIYI